MKRILSLLFAALLLSGFAKGQCIIRLSGHVHSSATHENLSGATVALGGRQLVTDPNGDFRFDSLCPGAYTLTVRHGSYDSVLQVLELARSQHLDLDLQPRQQALAAVTVTGLRTPPVSGDRKELSGRELEQTRGSSLSEALGRINGVSLLQTGSNIAKPVIHGLHGSRILTINNGIRQEGQQWGNEHAPEIDPFIAGKLTVLKGVDELRYGSDAVGGVVLVEPRALRNTPGSLAEFHTVYATNNRQYTVSGIFEQQLRKLPALSYRVQGTFRKGANVAAPDYRLNNTGLQDQSLSFTAGWRKEHINSELYYSFFATRNGIFTGAHIGNLTDLQNAINAPRPDPTFTGQDTYRIGRPYQDARHQLVKWKTVFDAGNSRFQVLLGGQHNNRKEYDVVRNAATRGPQIDLSITTFTEELNWEHPRTRTLNGVVGLTAMQQRNTYSGRYLIPNYQSQTFGAYAIEKWTQGRWNLDAGLRFDAKEIDTRRMRAGTQTLETYGFRFQTLASSFNAGYRIATGWKANATASLSTRAPHVNELLVDGIHHGTGTYERGDISLQPERSLNLSVSGSYTSEDKRLQVELTLYRNQIRDFIYQQPRPDSPVLTIRGAFPLIEYRSTDALLQGLDASVRVAPIEPMTYTLRLALLRARNQRTNDWLIWMPSDRITQELSYALPEGKKFFDTYFSAELATVLRQTRVPGEENGRQDYKVPPAGYALLNTELATSIRLGKRPLTLGISGRNLLNKRYRNYLNTFRYYTDEPGRNFSIRLKISLQSIKP